MEVIFISSFKETQLGTPYGVIDKILELNIDDTSVYKLSDVIKIAGTYTFSIWYKTNKSTNITFNILGNKNQILSDTTWKKIVKTVTIEEVSESNNYIDISLDTGSIGYFYEAYLSEGKSDTSWSPAPEDTDDNIYQIKSEFTQKAEEISGEVSDIDGNVSTITQKVGTIESSVETNKGDIAALKIDAKNIKLEVGKKDDVIPSQIRYIRDYLNGNDLDDTNYFCKIEVLSNETNLESGVINLASGLLPTSDTDIVDAVNYTDNDLDTFTSIPPGEHYLQLDLSQSPVIESTRETLMARVDSICVWHYYKDGRRCNHKLQVSSDGESWYTLYDSCVQNIYKETSDGKMYYMNDNNISKNMSFMDINIDKITQRVQENENNYSLISTEVGKIVNRVEEVEDNTNNVINNTFPEFESSVNKKIADIEIKADGITNSVTKIEGDLKQHGQEILEAGKWKVSLANIGGYDSKYADTEVYMELTPNGLTVSRSASDGYRTQITGDTIKIEYDNGRGVYENAMMIDKDLMYLTRVFVKNGIDHGTIKEIPSKYGNVGALLFVSSVGSNS